MVTLVSGFTCAQNATSKRMIMWTKEVEIPLLEQITLWDTLGKADLILLWYV